MEQSKTSEKVVKLLASYQTVVANMLHVVVRAVYSVDVGGWPEKEVTDTTADDKEADQHR